MLKRLGTGVLIRRKGMLAPIAAAGPAPYTGPLDLVAGGDIQARILDSSCVRQRMAR